jgi:ABC-type nitrate/sulfonate/bicarbonate transport system permease component
MPSASDDPLAGAETEVDLPAGDRWRAATIRVAWALVGFALLIVIWEVVVLLAHLPADTLPKPAAVARELGNEWHPLYTNALVTLREILIGFALAIAIGIPLATVIAFSRPLQQLLYPMIVVAQAVPKIVVAPLFVLWFGFGVTSNVLVAMLVAIFPIIVDTELGLTEVDRDSIRLATVMGGNHRRIFWKVRFPAALPSVFAGLKLAITFATLGAIAGELVAGQKGLGYIVNSASGNLNASLSFAAIVVMSVMGVVLFYCVVGLEHLTIRWKPQQAGGR